MSTALLEKGRVSVVEGDAIASQREQSRLRKLSNDQLVNELGTVVGIMVENFRKIALIVKEMDHRGMDLSSIHIPMLEHVRRIAAGEMLPEVLAKFATNRMALRMVSAMPIKEQRKALAGPIPVARRTADGGVQFKSVAVEEMGYRELKTVFDEEQGRMRRKEEQELVAKAANSHLRPIQIKAAEVDKKRGVVRVNIPGTYDAATLRKWLKALEA
jgi:hypothetical protein